MNFLLALNNEDEQKTETMKIINKKNGLEGKEKSFFNPFEMWTVNDVKISQLAHLSSLLFHFTLSEPLFSSASILYDEKRIILNRENTNRIISFF